MAKGMVIFGNASARAPSASTAEDAALEYFIGRSISGAYAPRPPIERCRAPERERFLTELERLEAKRRSDAAAAAEAAARREV